MKLLLVDCGLVWKVLDRLVIQCFKIKDWNKINIPI